MSYSKERHVETLVVADKTMVFQLGRQELQRYLLTIMNMVSVCLRLCVCVRCTFVTRSLLTPLFPLSRAGQQLVPRRHARQRRQHPGLAARAARRGSSKCLLCYVRVCVCVLAVYLYANAALKQQKRRRREQLTPRLSANKAAPRLIWLNVNTNARERLSDG